MTPPVPTDETSHAGLHSPYWMPAIELDQTGWDLGGRYQVIFISHHGGRSASDAAGLIEPITSGVETGNGLAAQAAALARERPDVEGEVPPVPRLSSNLAEDVHRICGLTWEQIAAVFQITERAAAGWRMQGVPPHREKTMEAMRAIGVILVGGLGPNGVARWLTAGEPSRSARLGAGEVDEVSAEARSFLDVPAT